MNEQEPNYEGLKPVEIDPQQSKEATAALAEKLREAAEKAEANKKSIEKLREKVEQVAPSKEQVEVSRLENGASESVLKASSQLKGLAFKQRMREIQRKEGPLGRRFSKIIHHPVVEEVSNVAEGTVARPSGLLFGGAFSVLSSLVILYIARHYGYEYNFLVGMAGFVGGFFLGLLLEGSWRLFKKH